MAADEPQAAPGKSLGSFDAPMCPVCGCRDTSIVGASQNMRAVQIYCRVCRMERYLPYPPVARL